MPRATVEDERRKMTRLMWEEQITHVRIGNWPGKRQLPGGVLLVGDARDLHGSVCTCCPRRP